MLAKYKIILLFNVLMGHKGVGYASLSFGCSNLPFSDARQLLDLRHNLGYFKLQSLKEECEKANNFISILDSAHISCNAVLMKYSCRYTYNLHLHTRTSISSRSSLFLRRMFDSSSLSSRDRSSGTERHDVESSSQIQLSANNF